MTRNEWLRALLYHSWCLLFALWLLALAMVLLVNVTLVSALYADLFANDIVLTPEASTTALLEVRMGVVTNWV